MRIRIDDDFDSEVEKEYKNVDSESVVGNGVLGKKNEKIVDVECSEIKKDINKKYEVNRVNEGIAQSFSNESGKQFKVELKGGIFIEDEYNFDSKDEQISCNDYIDYMDYIEDKNDIDDINQIDKIDNKTKEIKGKISVCSKLGNKKGTVISSARINLYMLNGISPKLISSKLSNEDGMVIFDNLEPGSYRVIAIVNRKYFEKPTYINWNEVTINDELNEENILVINRIKANTRK